jgi:hypothetical protein
VKVLVRASRFRGLTRPNREAPSSRATFSNGGYSVKAEIIDMLDRMMTGLFWWQNTWSSGFEQTI